MQSVVAAIECKVYRAINFKLYSAKCKLTDVKLLYQEVGLRTLKSRGGFSRILEYHALALLEPTRAELSCYYCNFYEGNPVR